MICPHIKEFIDYHAAISVTLIAADRDAAYADADDGALRCDECYVSCTHREWNEALATGANRITKGG